MSRSSFIRGVSTALVDQAVLSLINLAIGLVFVRFGSKAEYAIYAQVWAITFFTTLFQSALITAPALTMLPRKQGAERGQAAGSFLLLQMVLSLVFAAVAGVLCYAFPRSLAVGQTNATLAVAVALTVWTAWLRDFLRNQLFIGLHHDACLRLDAAYSLLCVAGMAALVWRGGVSASAMLLLMAAAGVATALPWLKLSGAQPHANRLWLRQSWHEAAPIARWALPGGVVAWAIGNLYVLISARYVGPDGTAEVVAARLFVSPLGTAYLALANVFRPRVSHWLAQGQVSTVRRVTRLAELGVVGGAVLYLGALLVAYPLLEHHVLGPGYRGLRADVAWWGLFFLASGLASVSTGMHYAMGSVRDTFVAALAGALCGVPLMVVFSQLWGKTGLMAGLNVGEIVCAVWLFISMRGALRRHGGVTG